MDIVIKVKGSKVEKGFLGEGGGIKAEISFWTLRPTEKWGTKVEN